MVLTVTTLFEVCIISGSVLWVLRDFGLCTISNVAIPISNTTIAFNSAVNPFAYGLISQRFREKMKGMLCYSSCANKGNIKAGHPRIIRLRAYPAGFLENLDRGSRIEDRESRIKDRGSRIDHKLN